MSKTPLVSFPWRSVNDFVDGVGNARVDVVRITLQRPQHGRSGRALFSAVNDRDGLGPRALTWRITHDPATWETVSNIFVATIHHLREPFM